MVNDDMPSVQDLPPRDGAEELAGARPSGPGGAARPVRSVHWAVRMNRRSRSACFALIGLAVALHAADQAHSPVTLGPLLMGLLLLQFLVYPQALYAYSRRAAAPLQAEISNMRLDALLFGIWSAGLGFPLWISFGMFVGATVNLVAFLGLRGFAQGAAAFAVGALPAAALSGWRLMPETGWGPTLLTLFGLTLYLVFVGNGAYQRSVSLHRARQKLLLSEQALQLQLEEIRALQGRLEEQVNRDPLTGLYNRRYLESTIERELARCKREGRPLSVMMLDVDHFKRINDTHGHQAGDEVLKQLAAILADKCRLADVVCRFGGEEFLLLLPDMPLEVALERAERLRAQFESTALGFGGEPIQATVSIGIANLPEHADLPEVLIGQADSALYRAKTGGRNRVIVGEPGDSRPFEG